MYIFLRGFFAIMGMIFCVLLLVLAYLVIADPFNLRPLYTMLVHGSPTPVATVVATSSLGQVEVSPATTSSAKTQPVNRPPAVSAAQAEALKTVGVDVTSIPTTFTPAQLDCFVKILGQSRVNEIKAGAVPTAAEFFSARACLE